MTSIQKVERAAAKPSRSRAELDEAIRQARADGQSLRVIAKAAGLSPEWVRRIAAS